MGMTSIAATIIRISLSLTVAGLVLTFGAWTLIPAGVVGVILGVVVDWEKVT